MRITLHRFDINTSRQHEFRVNICSFHTSRHTKHRHQSRTRPNFSLSNHPLNYSTCHVYSELLPKRDGSANSADAYGLAIPQCFTAGKCLAPPSRSGGAHIIFNTSSAIPRTWCEAHSTWCRRQSVLKRHATHSNIYVRVSVCICMLYHHLPPILDIMCSAHAHWPHQTSSATIKFAPPTTTRAPNSSNPWHAPPAPALTTHYPLPQWRRSIGASVDLKLGFPPIVQFCPIFTLPPKQPSISLRRRQRRRRHRFKWH